MNRVPGTYRTHTARVWRGPIPGTHEPGFAEHEIVEDLRNSKRIQSVLRVEQVHVFTMGACRIILGHEPGGVHGELRWHLTISCPDRHPTWDEIKTARYRLLGPDMVMAMVLPKPEHYVNLPAQDHVFQLWEIEDEARFWEEG